MGMIDVMRFPHKDMPEPVLVTVGTAWIMMIEKADFVPEKTEGAPADRPHMPEGDVKMVPVATTAALPVTRTKITLHTPGVLSRCRRRAEGMDGA